MRFMLIDGNSLTYRAFHALPTDLVTASGQVTNAVYGFTSMFINLVRDHRPDAVAVAFDRPEPTFRHRENPEYKAQREAAPDILRQQMALVRQVVDTLGVTAVDMAGIEADDIIATLATHARDRGDDVIIVTGDRDAYQLVEDPHVKVLYNKRGVSDYALYDEAGIVERTGVQPRQYVQYAALRGDTSDNLPGVPGVGEKTAAKLVNAYGDLDGIFAHTAEQTPKLRQNLEENQDQARRNVRLMELVRDVELPVGLDDLGYPVPDTEELRELFDFLEFRSLYDRLSEALGQDLGAPPSGNEVIEAEPSAATSAAAAVDVLTRLTEGSGPVAIAVSWQGADGRSPLAGLAAVIDDEAGDVAWIPGDLLGEGTVRNALDALLGARPVAAHGAKAFFRALLDDDPERPLPTLALDTMLAAYLLDPAETRYSIGDVLVRYARLELPDATAAPEGQLDLAGDSTDDSLASCRTALAVARLVGPIRDALSAQGLRALNDEIETPLVAVLARMEHLGVGVDRAELQDLNDRFTAEVKDLAARIQEDAGESFNVNSTPQLRTVLFDKLGLTPTKKTKTGYSTDAASLEKLQGQHPIIDHLLRYREVEKLRSTYGEGLLAEIGSDGRIHATFNQTVARTGRLSSDAPNLHNIPVRSEEGKAFRRAFVPADGFTLLVADYNQIELRCIAHLAEDPGLIAAFEAGDDIHTATAARVFHVSPEEVDGGQRAKAKMVSYGLAYGMEAYGLASRLNISRGEAAEILDAYFEAFPAVKQYMERTVAEARERGYTETLFGRRRPIPELASTNRGIRQAGERQAMNAGIQGLAADIFKVALVRLDARLSHGANRSRLVLQVHDEVILEVPPDERDAVAELTLDVMRGAADLRVPLEVNLSFGASWAEAK
ncbi:MAG: DNA polymerase I [Microthrixaceae bacterium]|nr:DNA polymerase I [Acidimicrobiales bacterium]MCB9404515.1 DNA polymerase I [Microthrixaceae bacterium]